MMSLMWHELIHLVHYMELWGPLPGWWAYPFERFYDYLTARVTAKTDPELSILKIVNVCSAFVLIRRFPFLYFISAPSLIGGFVMCCVIFIWFVVL
jgi:hypothetical protein